MEMRTLVLGLLVLLAAACSTQTANRKPGEILTFDPHGHPMTLPSPLRLEAVKIAFPDGTEMELWGWSMPRHPEYLLVGGDMVVPRNFPSGQIAPQGHAMEPIVWLRLWPEGRVPYTIDASVNKAQRQRIQEAIHHVQSLTPIRFVERTDEEDYVRFISDGVAGTCWSVVGRMGGPQDLDVYCGQDGVPSMGTVVHEMLHAPGFEHEHQRADRDAYVEILWDNIVDEGWSQFTKIGFAGRTLGTYDYDSVMHYHAKAFSKNGGYTIVPKNGIPPERLGSRDGLSLGDIAAIRDLYSSPFVRLGGNLHQISFSRPSPYSFNGMLYNVGAVPARTLGVEVGGTWLEGAFMTAGEILPGGSLEVTLRAKACPGPAIQADTIRVLLEGGTYEAAYTRLCYQYPTYTTLLQVAPAGAGTLQLTFAEWTWAKRFRVDGSVAGESISLPVTTLESANPRPLYTALLRLDAWRGKEVCLTLTPLDSTLTNSNPATACAVVP